MNAATITFLQYLHAQTFGGGVFSKLGSWLATQTEIPNGSDGATFYWIKENYENAEQVIQAYELWKRTVRRLIMTPAAVEPVPLEILSTAKLFENQKEVDWHIWPFAAIGLSSILDGLPKAGKTCFLLQGIKSSRAGQEFLGRPTKPVRVIYISEQSRASLAMQAQEVGFTGQEPEEEIAWISREQWSRHLYTELLDKLDAIVEKSKYDYLVCDTWHSLARMEDERDASEANRFGNLLLDLAARREMSLTLTRHDRKSGGEIGISGRNSIQLSGMVDVILHLTRLPGQADPRQRKLEMLGRVPGLPTEQIIELTENGYVNHGEVKGGTQTKKMTDIILERAPNMEATAMPIMEILKGSGVPAKVTQPLRDALEQLLSDGRLQSRARKKGKNASQTVYWTSDLVLKNEQF